MINAIFKTKKSISWNAEFPDFLELAKQMRVRLHKKRPFGVQEELDNSYITVFPRQVVFGENLLRKLDSVERLALAAHKLTHLKNHHRCKILLCLVLACSPVKWFLTYSSIGDAVSTIIIAILFAVIFIGASRLNEYAADAGSVSYAGKEPTLSLLRKHAEPQNKWYYRFMIHPSFQDRIRKIQKSYR